jgi:O-antigen ligase
MCAGAGAVLCVALAWLRPRAVVWWLPATVLLFNTVYYWLPWPAVKMAYIGPAAVCFATALRGLRRERWLSHGLISGPWWLFFVCLAVAGVGGVLSHVVVSQRAALHELWQMLRVAPLLDERNRFVPLRYLWVWALALATYWCMATRLRRWSEIRALAWSAQWCSVPMVLFGVYSFVTQRYMVSHYQLERRINATCSSPAALADILTVLVIANLFLLSATRTMRARLVLLAMLMAQVITILLSGCRINIALLAGVAAVWLLWWLRRVAQRRIRHAVAIACGVLLIVCGAGVVARLLAPASMTAVLLHVPGIERLQQVVQRSARKDPRAVLRHVFASRQDHWRTAFDAARSQPLWGIGCGLFEQRYTVFRANTDLFQFARVHNVYLRVLVEAGIVTVLAGIAALVMTAVACWRMWRGPATPQAVRHVAAALALLGVFAVTGLLSDLLYENTECIMSLCMLCACAMASANWIARAQHPAVAAEPLLTDEEPVEAVGSIHTWLMLLTWGYHARVSWWKLALGVALAVAVFIGWHDAQTRARQRFITAQTSFGLDRDASYAMPDDSWRALRRTAAEMLRVEQPVLVVQWRALNERAVTRDQRLTILLNGVPVLSAPVDALQPRTLYCDVSALQGTDAVLSYHARRTFQPWHEGWFVDARAHAALVRAPQWIGAHPTNVVFSTRGRWNAVWSTWRDTYAAMGLSNATWMMGATGPR